jgi:hypothetical protein
MSYNTSYSNTNNICKFNVGNSIEVKNKILFMGPYPYTEQLIKYKVGRISKVLPLNAYGECYYNILFDDNTIAVEVSEKLLNIYYDYNSNSQNNYIDLSQLPLTNGSNQFINNNTLANLALLNNLNNLNNFNKQSVTNNSQFINSSNNSQLINGSNQFINNNTLANLALLNNLNDLNKKSVTNNSQLMNSLLYTYNTEDVADVGDNPKLQEDVTNFYLTKIKKWFKKNPEFIKLKKHTQFIESPKGIAFVYKILKSFIKRNKLNWYDLRSDENYDNIKDYIRDKLLQIDN